MASRFFSNDDTDMHEVGSTVQVDHQADGAHALAAVPLRIVPSAGSAATATQADGAAHPRRLEVAPPSLFGRSRPVWKTWMSSFWCWLWDMDELPQRPAAATGLRKIKSEFNSAMWDLQSIRANQVRAMVEQARSLRELWHLRADVFRVIAVHRGQIEAQLRVDALDSHFPVRSSSRDSQRSSKVTTW